MKFNKDFFDLKMKVTASICVLIIVAISFGTKITKPTPAIAQTNARVNHKEDNDEEKKSSSENRKSNSTSDEISNSTSDKIENRGSENSSVSSHLSKSDKSDTLNENESSSNGKYRDGTYEGEGKGFKSQIRVQVTVSSGEITDIKVLEGADDADYFNRAQSLLNDIIKNQSTDVNVVSGATFSSNGLIQAVNNALSNGGM